MKLYLKLISFLFYFNILSLEEGFLFSVIIPIYNTGRYLDDSVGSLLNQTINFKNIQVILVNDGSTDNSEEICLKYKNNYPKNIIYINIEHGGVSKARNEGMKYAKGNYINFLDPDDKWDHRAFKSFALFFKYYKQINFIAGRIRIFEAENNYHPLDYKFYKTRISNLIKEYNCIQLSICSSILKKSLVKDNYFDENVKSNEDTLFINNILLYKPIIGFVREAVFFYRRRIDSSSVVQNYKKNLEFYFDTINYVFNNLISNSIKLYKKVLPFIQFLIGYDILFRIKQQAYKYMDSNNFRKYFLIVKKILNNIDDRYILEQKILSNQIKLFALSKKHERDLRYDIKLKKDFLIYSNKIMINLKTNKNIISWRILELKNKILYLEGLDNFWMPKEKYYYFCKINNKIFYPKYMKSSHNDFITFLGTTENGRIIKFKIPLEPKNVTQNIKFYISFSKQKSEIFTSLSLFTHIPPISNGYYISENFIFKFIDNEFKIYRYDKNIENDFENNYCYELERRKKNDIINLRKTIKEEKRNKRRKIFEIWIINDRHDKAGGYGENFFRYLMEKKPKGIISYFVIQKNCSDYNRLIKIGNILELHSFKFLKYFLEADKIISSMSDKIIDNPFDDDFIYITDLIHFEKIYLSNKIIEDDFFYCLNKYTKNYNFFFISSIRRHYSNFEFNYNNNKENDILMRLYNSINNEKIQNQINKEKKIIIVPTWRINIEGTRDYLNIKSIYSNTFKFTEFFNFYNNLINNPKLNLFMKKHNYKGTICLHYLYSLQLIDFNQNEIFSVSDDCDYKNILFEYSLLITDYSNIFFDFGYLGKPVIYTHFDYEEYINNHFQKQFFDYDSQGFGPICKDIKSTINEIIFEIKQDCKLRGKYLRRIKKFFRHIQFNDNERIFNEITRNRNNNDKNSKNIFTFFLVFVSIIILYKLRRIKNIYISKSLSFYN